MKKYVKSYNMFFPNRIFGILLYLVYPVLIVGSLFIERIFFDNYVILITTTVFVFIIECMADLFIFAGYARKESSRHEYLKTSIKYIQIFKRAFMFDIVRRLLSILIIMSVTSAILRIPINIAVFITVSLILFIIVSLCILRFFDYFVFYYIITIIMMLVYGFFIIIMCEKNIYIISGIMITTSILAILIHIKILFKVIKEGYHD